MNYTILIAAAFILATIAVAALSPFDHLPQVATPQQTAAAAPTDDGSAADDTSYSGSSSSVRGHWAAGESPPQ